MFIHLIRLREPERAVLFVDDEPKRLLTLGVHCLAGRGRSRIERFSVRAPWLEHPRLEVLMKSGVLDEQVRFVQPAPRTSASCSRRPVSPTASRS